MPCPVFRRFSRVSWRPRITPAPSFLKKTFFLNKYCHPGKTMRIHLCQALNKPLGKKETVNELKEKMKMNNKITGSIFCLIAAILLGARYVAAAIFMSNTPTWSADIFASALAYVGPVLLIAAIAACVVGLGFLAAGILKDCRSK